MKIFGNNFKIFIFTFASMLLGVFLWDKINLPYSNPENIYGVLSINKFNPINNDLRFLTFGAEGTNCAAFHKSQSTSPATAANDPLP